VYGSQQDNSTLSLPSSATGTGITLQHWESHGGCETGPVAIKPDDPAIVVSGCFGGRLARYNRRTEQFRQIRPYPERQDGAPEKELRYRIQWNAPVIFSQHDPTVLYHGSQYVAKSLDQGGSWTVISPDLTGNDESKFEQAGGPITADVTGVEIYSALLQIAESPHNGDVLWTGSNDGRVHITQDGSGSWTDVTPDGLPQPSTINRIEASPHQPGTAYLAAYRYRLDDFEPYIFTTRDYGATWTRLTDGQNGLPADHPTRVVRADPDREGLLYAGTEFGLFTSFDDGAHWQPLQLNLPRSPVTDLVVHRGDLVVATQGRGFWLLDDITPLHHVALGTDTETLALHPVRPVYRTAAQERDGHYVRDHVYGAMIPRYMKADNPPEGATFYFTNGSDRTGSVEIHIQHQSGDSVRTFTDVEAAPGLNRFSWNLDYPRSRTGGAAARAVPGTYRVTVESDDASASQEFQVLMDPRLAEEVTVADLQVQFDFLMTARERLNELSDALEGLRNVRAEADGVTEAGSSNDQIKEAAERASLALTAVEGVLIQPAGAGFANPSRIRSHLQFVMTAASAQRGEDLDSRPTDQLQERLGDLQNELSAALNQLRTVYAGEVAELNEQLVAAGMDAIEIPVVPGRRPVS
ncbi:MAG: glycosyl hydrolase, partial [Longimicrobiales bacterium]